MTSTVFPEGNVLNFEMLTHEELLQHLRALFEQQQVLDVQQRIRDEQQRVRDEKQNVRDVQSREEEKA